MAEPIPIPNLTLPSSIFNRSLLTSIYDLWFQGIPLDAGAPGPEARHRWFGMDATAEQKAAFDASCAALCLPALEHLSPSRVALPAAVSAASPASYAAVAAPFLALPVFADAAVEAAVKADAMLSLVLLFDQMPRNIHRALQAQAPIYTHYDTIARALVYSVIADADADAASASPVRGLHRHPVVFASSLKFNWYLLPLMHSEDLADHDLLLKVAQPKEEQLGLLLQMEKRHRVLLERFGRYPHRNVQLGRSMTEEERVFLHEGGDTFGTG